MQAVGELENVGDKPEEIEPLLVAAPSLALEITREDGVPVLLPPPPVPGAEETRVVLGPGESYRATYASFLPAWTEPGTYQVRIRYRGAGNPVASEWVTIVVGED